MIFSQSTFSCEICGLEFHATNKNQKRNNTNSETTQVSTHQRQGSGRADKQKEGIFTAKCNDLPSRG